MALITGGGAASVVTTNGQTLDVVERSTDLSLSATSAATAATYITGNALTFDGSTKVLIEIQVPFTNASAGNQSNINIWEDSTDLGAVCFCIAGMPARGAVVRTPSAGNHTYTVKAWKTAGSVQLSAGAASASGVLCNAVYRVERIS